MKSIKISDAELKVMKYIWEQEGIKASNLVKLIKADLGWSRTTTYTQINRLIDKGAIKKDASEFSCYSLVSKQLIQLEETQHLIDKLYKGSRKLFLSAFLEQEKLTDEELNEIRQMIEKRK